MSVQPTAYVYSSSDEDRSRAADALLNDFAVIPFDSCNAFVNASRKNPPHISFIDDHEGEGVRICQYVRKMATCRPPVLLASHSVLPDIEGLHPLVPVIKPWRERVLAAAARSAVGKGAASGIDTAALDSAVETLTLVADAIGAGQDLPPSRLVTAIDPLVSVVRQGRFEPLFNNLRRHDDYMLAHSVRVATTLTHFGASLGLKDGDLALLATGGALHDIGKLAIPLRILNKPGPLNEKEWQAVKMHVDLGEQLLTKIPDLPREVMHIVAHHHERLDGSGYPRGLKGGQISDVGRMAAVVDVFVALTDRRSYKKPMSAEEAFGLIRSGKTGAQDGALVSLLEEAILDVEPVRRTG